MGIRIDPEEVERSGRALSALSSTVKSHVPQLDGVAEAIAGADSADAVRTADRVLDDLGTRVRSLLEVQAAAVAACARDHHGTDDAAGQVHRGGYRTAMDAV